VGEPVALLPGSLPQGPARNFLHDFFFRNAPAAPLPGGQVLAARQLSGRGIFL